MTMETPMKKNLVCLGRKLLSNLINVTFHHEFLKLITWLCTVYGREVGR